jgi:hypothetical protein
LGTVGDGTGMVGGRDGDGDGRGWDADKIEIFTVSFFVFDIIEIECEFDYSIFSEISS